MGEILLCWNSPSSDPTPLHFGDFVREDSDGPLYLIGDHLGSTSLVNNSSGQEVAKRSYLPFGDSLSGFPAASGVCQGSGEPGSWGVSATELQTDYTYTGQREAAEIGLKYYVARWYDSEIGHFLQANSVISKLGNPMARNRYAYENYNPLMYIDPSGYTLFPPNQNIRMTDGGWGEQYHVYDKKAGIDYEVTYNHARMVTAVNPDGTVDVTEALGTYYKKDAYPNEIVTRDFWDVSEGHEILSYVVIRIDEHNYGGIYP